MIGGMISTISGGKAKVDVTTDSIKLGTGAGVVLNTDDDDNIAIGTDALSNTASNSNNNSALGRRALLEVTSGDNNIGIGTDAGNVITSSSTNTCVGAYSDVNATAGYATAVGAYAITQNAYESRFGFNGGFQFYSVTVVCDLGGVAENDPAHATPIAKIPRHSVITRATAVITRVSSDANHTLKLVLSTDSSGTDNTALAGVQEVIGASGTESWSSIGGNGAAADINAASGANVKTAYAAASIGGNNGLSTIDTTAADLYLYLAFADTNHTGGDADPTTGPKVRVYIEFAGED